MKDDKIYVLLGAGGHAKVVLSLHQAAGLKLVGVCDPKLVSAGALTWQGNDVLGGDEALAVLDPTQTRLLNGIGIMPNQDLRGRLQAHWEARGFIFPVCVHPTAWVAPDAVLGSGVQVMAGAVIQPGCTIGAGTIINTRACVDHDSKIGKQVHIAPGATLCGDVTIGDGVFIGAGATVVNGREIGARAFIAAGAVQVDDAGENERSFGLYTLRKRVSQ